MTEASGDMRLFVEQIVQALVDVPDQVQVTSAEREDATVVELRVAPDDMGKVIGRHGRTVKSIRTLLGLAGERLNKRYALDLVED